MKKILFSIIFTFCSFSVMAFEILKFNGKVEYSFDNKNWKNLLVKQKFKSGVWIKTGPKAKVTLLLPNRTQTILSRNTTVQLNDNKKKKSTGIKLNMGKIWAKTNKKPVKNSELWKILDSLNDFHNIHWNWVKGHSGHPGNEKADALANLGIEKL